LLATRSNGVSESLTIAWSATINLEACNAFTIGAWVQDAGVAVGVVYGPAAALGEACTLPAYNPPVQTLNLETTISLKPGLHPRSVAALPLQGKISLAE
jgi:hypothetical protein